MKKNGFLATSVLYSFFLCFCILMVGLLANYTHQALIFDKSSTPLTYEKETFYLTLTLPAMYGYDYADIEALGLTIYDITLENNIYTLKIPLENLTDEKIIKIYGDKYTTLDNPLYHSLFNVSDDTNELIGMESETNTCKIVSNKSDTYEDYTQVKLQVNSNEGNLECDLTDTKVALLFDLKLDQLTDSLANKLITRFNTQRGFETRSYSLIDNEMYMMNKMSFKDVPPGGDACIFNKDLSVAELIYTGNANNYFSWYNNVGIGCLEFNINQLYPVEDKEIGIASRGSAVGGGANNNFAPAGWKKEKVLIPIYNNDDDDEIKIWDLYDINGAYNIGKVTASVNVLTVYSTTQLEGHGSSAIDIGTYEYLGSSNKMTINNQKFTVYAYNVYLEKGASGSIIVDYGRACSGCENSYVERGLRDVFETSSYEFYDNWGTIKYILNGYKGGSREAILIQSEHEAPGGDDEFIYIPEFDEDGDWIQG